MTSSIEKINQQIVTLVNKQQQLETLIAEIFITQVQVNQRIVDIFAKCIIVPANTFFLILRQLINALAITAKTPMMMLGYRQSMSKLEEILIDGTFGIINAIVLGFEQLVRQFATPFVFCLAFIIILFYKCMSICFLKLASSFFGIIIAGLSLKKRYLQHRLNRQTGDTKDKEG
ncbi:hypothetical protein [Nostoc sp.]|uniref:hypothetical protein n=1 Tax=Nostoc sp. TaxID=1180 RepID=UPI002FFBBF3C